MLQAFSKSFATSLSTFGERFSLCYGLRPDRREYDLHVKSASSFPRSRVRRSQGFDMGGCLLLEALGYMFLSNSLRWRIES